MSYTYADLIPIAKFPLQISFNLTLTAHQVPEDVEYPPRVRRMSIYYDYLNKKGRADISEGYEAAKRSISGAMLTNKSTW